MHFGAVVYAQQTQATDSLESTSEIKVLEEVIVTDSRVPLKRSQSGKPVIKRLRCSNRLPGQPS